MLIFFKVTFLRNIFLVGFHFFLILKTWSYYIIIGKLIFSLNKSTNLNLDNMLDKLIVLVLFNRLLKPFFLYEFE